MEDFWREGQTCQMRSIWTAAPDGTLVSADTSPLMESTTLTALAGRISSPTLIGVGPKNMQNCAAWRPVPEGSEFHDFVIRFLSSLNRDAEVYLVSPCAGRSLHWQSVPYLSCGGSAVQSGSNCNRAGCNLDFTLTQVPILPVNSQAASKTPTVSLAHSLDWSGTCMGNPD